MPERVAQRIAGSFISSAASGAGRPHALVHQVQLAFAHSTQTVSYCMAAVMAVTGIVALRGLPHGRVEAPDDEPAPTVASPGT